MGVTCQKALRTGVALEHPTTTTTLPAQHLSTIPHRITNEGASLETPDPKLGLSKGLARGDRLTPRDLGRSGVREGRSSFPPTSDIPD